MTGAHNVHLGGTNLDFQVELYSYERKSEGIYLITWKTTRTSWDAFSLKIKPHTPPRRSATTWDPETQTAQRLHTLGWGHRLGDLTPTDTPPKAQKRHSRVHRHTNPKRP